MSVDATIPAGERDGADPEPGIPAGTSRQELRRDAWIGVATMLGAVLYLVLIPSQVQSEHDGFAHISGRTLPYLIGTTVLVLGALLSVLAARRSRRAPVTDVAPSASGPTLRVAVYTGAIALYAIGIGQLGYVTSSLVMLLFAMWFSGERRWLVLLVATIATPLVLYGFFHVVMQIPLPETPLY